jgi:hypothetical protein
MCHRTPLRGHDTIGPLVLSGQKQWTENGGLWRSRQRRRPMPQPQFSLRSLRSVARTDFGHTPENLHFQRLLAHFHIW